MMPRMLVSRVYEAIMHMVRHDWCLGKREAAYIRCC